MTRPPVIRVSGLNHLYMNGIYVDNWGTYTSLQGGIITTWEEQVGLVHWNWLVYDVFFDDYILIFTAITESEYIFPAKEDWIDHSGVWADNLVVETAIIPIEEYGELYMIRYTPSTLAAHYEQVNDLQMPAWEALPIGTSSNRFTGIYDGKGHKVFGWRSATAYTPDRGLFGQVQNARIENIHLRNSIIYGDGQSGTLIGDAWGMTTVRDCSATGTHYARFNNQGGLIGRISGGIVERCWSDVQMLGQTSRPSIINHGGLIGAVANWSGSTLIKDCYALGNVIGGANCDNAGGFIGFVFQDVNLSIENSYSMGLTTGRSAVGQFTGNDTGISQAVKNCYWISDNAASVSATGQRLSLVQGRDQGSYNSWDFTTVWNREDGLNGGFPFLDPREAPAAASPPRLLRGHVLGPGLFRKGLLKRLIHYNNLRGTAWHILTYTVRWGLC